MHREIKLTADGSHTIAIPEINVTYHSHHGAIAESRHVYIEAGLQPLLNRQINQAIRILEIGFGTGLNALLSFQEAVKNQQPVHYTAIELFPLSPEETARINHGSLLLMQDVFDYLHASPWNEEVIFNPFFTLLKKKESVLNLGDLHAINCIYFDAFAPTDQPELWTQAVFENLFQMLSPKGILVTYCSKSIIRKNMEAVGFTIQKLPGPHGKRDMVKAVKN